MDKTPLAAVSDKTVDIWYEGPTFVVADKPSGMPLHPTSALPEDSLVNILLGQNRWLAEMETSYEPGVIHRLRAVDRGLVLVAKAEETAQFLREALREQQLTFSYRVRVPDSTTFFTGAPVTVRSRREYPDGAMVADLDSPIGDTEALTQACFGDTAGEVRWVLYRIEVPRENGTRMTIALGDQRPLADIKLYTAPP